MQPLEAAQVRRNCPLQQPVLQLAPLLLPPLPFAARGTLGTGAPRPPRRRLSLHPRHQMRRRRTSCHCYCCCCCWTMTRMKTRLATSFFSSSWTPSCSPSWARARATPSSFWISCPPSSPRDHYRLLPQRASSVARRTARALAPGMGSACWPTRTLSSTASRASTACSPCSQQPWREAPHQKRRPEVLHRPDHRSRRSRLAPHPCLRPSRHDRCNPCGMDRSLGCPAAAHPAHLFRAPVGSCHETSIASAAVAIASVIDIAAAREIDFGPSLLTREICARECRLWQFPSKSLDL